MGKNFKFQMSLQVGIINILELFFDWYASFGMYYLYKEKFLAVTTFCPIRHSAAPFHPIWMKLVWEDSQINFRSNEMCFVKIGP
jgi:hypothetical protein